MAGKLDLQIEQGASFDRVFTWKDGDGSAVDLTGYAARMQVRESFGSPDAVLDLSSETGALSLGGAAGTIFLSLSAAETGALDVPDDGTEAPRRRLVYDLELSQGTYARRLLQGGFTVSKAVTR